MVLRHAHALAHPREPWVALMPVSYWVASTRTPVYPRLDSDQEVDVVVIGAGITGLLTALLIAQQGRTVAVLEAGEVGAGTTGYTTGKVTPLHGLVYDELSSRFGGAGAAIYASGQQLGLDLIRRVVSEWHIECDLRDRIAVTYAADESQASAVDDEAQAAREAGLRAELVTSVGLPFETFGGVRTDDSAEIHARKFCLGVAEAICGLGSAVYEHTTVTGLHAGRPAAVETADGIKVHAEHVVVATLMPIFDRALFWTRLTAKRSYAITCAINGEPPEGMFISAGQPTRSIRAVHDGDRELLMVGGEGHTTGEEPDTRERYATLEAFAREHWDVTEITHRWSAHDLQPADGLPYIGRYTPMSKNVWMAAGYRKWGLTNGAMAAELLSAQISGDRHPWTDFFDPYRFTPLRSAKGVGAEIVKDARHLVGDRLHGANADELEHVPKGEARIVRVSGSLVGAYRQDDGTLHGVKPTCTHVGCRLGWNTAERSWDCPCHGSRFGFDGQVLQGPATKPLSRVDVPRGS